jgi:hypothetical protein
MADVDRSTVLPMVKGPQVPLGNGVGTLTVACGLDRHVVTCSVVKRLRNHGRLQCWHCLGESIAYIGNDPVG